MLAWAEYLRALAVHSIVWLMEKVVVLDNIRSAHNVGSIFRTADGAGVKKLYLVGPTPTPIDRFGRIKPEIKKTSLGASESVEWEHIGESTSQSTTTAVELLNKLKSEGFIIVVVEQTADSILLKDFVVPDKVAYVLGAEVEGVQPDLIKVADQVVEIPMQGQKESLNVSVTAGIILFH